LNDIFIRLENLNNKGIIIDVVAIDQIENGNKEQILAGDIPLTTYTVEVMKETAQGLNMLYQESCDTFKKALEVGVKWAEGYNSEG
jgi:hypothetical protein